MSLKRTVGIVLIVIGIVALVWGGIFWHRDKSVVDIGPVKINTEERHGVALPPVLGVVTLIGGILLVAIPDRR